MADVTFVSQNMSPKSILAEPFSLKSLRSVKSQDSKALIRVILMGSKGHSVHSCPVVASFWVHERH